MRAPLLIKAAVMATVLFGHSVLADTLTLNLNYETTSAGVTSLSTTANSLQVPGTYNYSHTVTNGQIPSVSGVGFYDDYIFSISPALINNVVSTIDLFNVVGIQNFQVRLIAVSDASQPGTTGNPGASLIMQKWSDVINCGTGCAATLNIIPPSSLVAGTYDLQIRGTTDAGGGSFGGVLNTAPVPLPAALPLLLSGFGLLGGLLRRRVA